jgi:hypothetical protein
MPLYLAEAVCVEAVALVVGRERPLALGAIGGLLCGTVGLAAEWAWVGAVFRLKWNAGILPEALIVAPIAGVAGGLLGGLLGSGLRFRMPAPGITRAAALGSFVAVAALVAYGLATVAPKNVSATVALQNAGGDAEHRQVTGTVTLHPKDAADDAAWISATAWQDGGMHVDRLRRVGEGVYRWTSPIPVYGDWKSVVRIQKGRTIMAIPVYMPLDSAIPAPEVPAKPQFTRAFVPDRMLLQRERKDDVPGWLWTAACLVVLALGLTFMASLAWGVARVARQSGDADDIAPPPAGAPHADRRARFGRQVAPRGA